MADEFDSKDLSSLLAQLELNAPKQTSVADTSADKAPLLGGGAQAQPQQQPSAAQPQGQQQFVQWQPGQPLPPNVQLAQVGNGGQVSLLPQQQSQQLQGGSPAQRAQNPGGSPAAQPQAPGQVPPQQQLPAAVQIPPQGQQQQQMVAQQQQRLPQQQAGQQPQQVAQQPQMMAAQPQMVPTAGYQTMMMQPVQQPNGQVMYQYVPMQMAAAPMQQPVMTPQGVMMQPTMQPQMMQPMMVPTQQGMMMMPQQQQQQQQQQLQQQQMMAQQQQLQQQQMRAQQQQQFAGPPKYQGQQGQQARAPNQHPQPSFKQAVPAGQAQYPGTQAGVASPNGAKRPPPTAAGKSILPGPEGEEAHLNPKAEPFVPATNSEGEKKAETPNITCHICKEGGFLTEYVLRSHIRAKHVDENGEVIENADAQANGTTESPATPPAPKIPVEHTDAILAVVKEYLGSECSGGSGSVEQVSAHLKESESAASAFAAALGLCEDDAADIMKNVPGLHVFTYSADDISSNSISSSVATAGEVRVAIKSTEHQKMDSLRE